MLSVSNSVSLLYDQDGEPQRIYASPGYFSQWLEAPDNRALTFYKELPSQDGQGAPIKKTLAQAKLPAGEGPFLILMQQKEGKDELFTTVLDHSLGVFPSSQYRILNLSKRRMAVQLADQNMLLKPGQTERVAYPSTRKTWLKVAVNDKESGWIKVVSKPRPVHDTTRTSIIIMDIPPSEKDPDPMGVIVREAREQIQENQEGDQSVL